PCSGSNLSVKKISEVYGDRLSSSHLFINMKQKANGVLGCITPELLRCSISSFTVIAYAKGESSKSSVLTGDFSSLRSISEEFENGDFSSRLSKEGSFGINFSFKYLFR